MRQHFKLFCFHPDRRRQQEGSCEIPKGESNLLRAGLDFLIIRLPKYSTFLLRFPNCCHDWRRSRRTCTSRAPTASTSPGRRGVRRGGNEGAERRKEEVGKEETASQRGEKVEVGLEVANTQLTSRLARSLESQVIRKPLFCV